MTVHAPAIPSETIEPTIGPRGRRQLLPPALRQPATVLAAAILLILILAAILAPVLAPYSPNANSLTDTYQLPSLHHLLGTDELGRDLLSRVMFGGRVSLVGVAQALVVYLILGVTFGIIAGYVGGVVESVIVWISDVSFALPQIIVVLTILAIFSNNSSAAMLALGLLGAPGLAVFIRGVTKTVSAELFISAARVSGLTGRSILIRHILPQVSAPLIVQTSLFAATALLFQTGLDFLGLATQPPTATWGSMVAEGANYIGTDVWMVMPGGIVIVLAIVALGLIGDGLQDSRSDQMSSSSRTIESRRGSLRTVPSIRADRHADRSRDAQVESPGSILQVRGLTVTTAGADPVPIVQDVTFSLEPGECLGIVGESGSGKTMTALAVVGLLPEGTRSSEGEITFDGQNLRTLDERQWSSVRGSGIGMISQEPIANLDPSFTVEHQIAEVLRRHERMSAREARAQVLTLLRQVQLPNPEQVAKRYPHQLSGGMAQRVLIATALAAKPKILIADEPTTALDVSVQAEILELLRELRTRMGLAVILVSHDWGVIADSCDKVIVMYAGEVVEETDIATVFNDAKHPYSYELMAANPHFAKEPRTLLPIVPGSVPPIGSWPIGCHFASRCKFATDDCLVAPVDLEPIEPDHWTRCIHAELVPDMSTLESK